MAVSKLPKDEIKKNLGDVLFEIVNNAETTEGCKYKEPSGLAEIKVLRREYNFSSKTDIENIESKIYGAWMGRICGCMLGKTVECIRTNELIPFLKETNNYPMHRYIYKSDLTDEICEKYKRLNIKSAPKACFEI